MLQKKNILLLIIGFILLGVVILGLGLRNGPSLSPLRISRENILKGPAGGSPTATAFKPLSSTATFVPTEYPTPTPTPTPTPIIVRPIGRERGVDPIEEPDNQVTIMLLGSDQREGAYVGRTDTMILVTINTKENTVNVTSFPRDLYVYIPGWKEQRLNAAYPHAGFEQLQETFAYNFGFTPDFYVMVNFWAFEYFVDDLGGFYINVPRTICDDKWGGGESHCVYPGTHHMNGREALWYVRSRVTTNDYDRNYRQQLVLEALLQRMLALKTLTRIPGLYRDYSRHVSTNLDLGTILTLIPTAAKLSDKSLITQYFINQDAVKSWITPTGAHVLLPNFETIRVVLKAALNSPSE
jgi:LCP family protein required for cell wall assembly